MDNVWFTDDNEAMVSWDAVLSPHWALNELLDWTQRVVQTGAETQVLVPVAVSAYQAFGDGATARVVAGLADGYRAGTIDLLDFASDVDRHAGNLLLTRIAAADQDGRVREYMAARASDLPAAIWGESGRPDRDDTSTFFLEVSVYGLTNEERRAEGFRPRGDLTVSFHLFSNIWFPWIPHPTLGDGYDYDNRPLANVHTPRLNAFLGRVKSITEAMGGRWGMEALSYQSMAHETGIDLAWQPPVRTN